MGGMRCLLMRTRLGKLKILLNFVSSLASVVGLIIIIRKVFLLVVDASRMVLFNVRLPSILLICVVLSIFIPLVVRSRMVVV